MEFNFVKFENLHKRTEDRITVTGNSTIGFPTKFYNDNNIVSFKYVVLFYDKDNNAIGIYFTNSEEEKSKFSILHSKKGYGGHIVARSFFKTQEIDPKKYRNRYLWEKRNIDGVGEIFVILLKERVE